MKKLTLTSTALLLAMNVVWADTPETAASPSGAAAKLPLGYIVNGGLTWAPITTTAVNFAKAEDICSSSTALGYKWRLPTKDELVALTRYDGSVLGVRSHIAYRNLNKPSRLRDQGWTLHDVWSSTAGTIAGLQFIVNLEGGIANYGDVNGISHVTCVKVDPDK